MFNRITEWFLDCLLMSLCLVLVVLMTLAYGL